MTVRTIASLLTWAAIAAFAQTTAPLPSFEVASVKPTDPSHPSALRFSGGPGTDSPGQLTITNFPLYLLIVSAYNVHLPWTYVMPPSMPSGRYDIVAKIPPGTTQEEFHLMLQNLLIERFGLVVHKEMREMRTYDLLVAKDGPKIAAYQPPPEGVEAARALGASLKAAALPKDKDGWPIPPPGVVGVFNARVLPKTRTMFRGQPISGLVEYLEAPAERPVIDKTGLTGLYDFDVTFATPEVSAGASTDPASPERRQAGEDFKSQWLAGMMAAAERLGLKVVSSKGPVEVVVFDRVNSKPTEN
ncbi:MAG: TIGR03435 family protein [Bryobacteraceae bacterium]|jgi:uncharacterized protein (TIGR03435 family)